MDAPKPALTASPMMLALLALPVLLIGGAIGWAWHSSGSDPASGLTKGERAAIEAVVKDYILTHPDSAAAVRIRMEDILEDRAPTMLR